MQRAERKVRNAERAEAIAHRVERGVLVIEFLHCATPESEESARVAETIADIASENPCLPIVVNLHMLQLISSELIERLASLGRAMAEEGRKFALCCLRPEVATLYEVLNLHQLFPRYETLDEAFRALGRA